MQCTRSLLHLISHKRRPELGLGVRGAFGASFSPRHLLHAQLRIALRDRWRITGYQQYLLSLRKRLAWAFRPWAQSARTINCIMSSIWEVSQGWP